MTNFSENIERARRIIGFYYDGTSTPEDLTWVKQYFSTVDIDDLPDNLKEDAEIFKMIEKENSEIEDAVPDNLEGRIRAIMTEEPRVSKKGIILRFVAWTSAAAALVILLLNILPLGLQNNMLQIGGESLAVLINEPDEDGYVQITDAEDAAKIIAGSMNLAGETMDVVYERVSKTDNKMKKLDDKINKILNHKSLKAS
ncbi:MAG: hypothetical protein K2J12_07590 [Muribaculaceae bacterium]|nr:hypothetical protein [Muribaculaceae bacterium]